MMPQNYVVVTAHRSEFPQPIHFTKGAALTIGEQYQGPEDWDNWYFCTVEGLPGGWVPAQVIHWDRDGFGTALEDYTARELDVDPGDTLSGNRILNGWAWCHSSDGKAAGWVPLENLREAP
ncbi:SH3 domain-containing protein [Marinobacter xestospongiae]